MPLSQMTQFAGGYEPHLSSCQSCRVFRPGLLFFSMCVGTASLWISLDLFLTRHRRMVMLLSLTDVCHILLWSFPAFLKESLIKVYFAITPEGRGPTAVIISVKRREEIRKSVGDLLKLLAPQARKPKKQKLMFLLRFFSLLFIVSLKFRVQLQMAGHRHHLHRLMCLIFCFSTSFLFIFSCVASGNQWHLFCPPIAPAAS